MHRLLWELRHPISKGADNPFSIWTEVRVVLAGDFKRATICDVQVRLKRSAQNFGFPRTGVFSTGVFSTGERGVIHRGL